MNLRSLFQSYLAQTSDDPIALEITGADGNYLISGEERYLDLIGGISVCNYGHQNPEVIRAVQKQAEKYLHVMVYGELIQSPQVQYAEYLCQKLGTHFESIFFTNSGSEAIEAAMKLAKKATNRTKIIAFRNSYHGSTQGALSILGDEYWRRNYRPLLPEIYHYDYGDMSMIEHIDETVATVIMEPIQAEAGVSSPSLDFLRATAQKCKDTNTLLTFDEVQTGFGRTGSYFRFQKLGIDPDIIVLGKALGAGMPLGAIATSRQLMASFSDNPVLGHITTFGGHPVSCAAGLAGARFLESSGLLEQITAKADFLAQIKHSKISKINVQGLWAAVFLADTETCFQVCKELRKEYVFTDWFLFAQNALRISPPLTITLEELQDFQTKLYRVLDRI